MAENHTCTPTTLIESCTTNAHSTINSNSNNTTTTTTNNNSHTSSYNGTQNASVVVMAATSAYVLDRHTP
jgi:hypothetical protein